MNTQQRIDAITEELRGLYLNTNEGPRLIHALTREFPYPRRVWNDNAESRREIKGGWGMAATERGRG